MSKKRPVLVGLKLCKKVVVDAGTGHVSLVKCMRRLRATKVPTPPQQYFVTCALADGLGETTLTLRMSDLSAWGETFAHSWKIELSDPVEERWVYIRLPKLVFPRFGRYEFVLQVDGDWFAQCTIDVEGKQHEASQY